MPPATENARAPFECSLNPVGAVQVVDVSGEVDMVTAEELRECVDSALDAAGPVLVDLRQVTFMDSSGLGVLFEAAKRLDSGRTFGVVHEPQGAVATLFRIVHVGRVLQVFTARERALDALR